MILDASGNLELTEGNISGSATSTGSFGQVESAGRILLKGTSDTIGAAAITQHSNGYVYITGGSSGIVLGDDATSSRIQILDDSEIRFEVNGTERAVIDANSRISLSNTDAGGTAGKDSTTGNTLFGYGAGGTIDANTINNTFIGHGSGDGSKSDAQANTGLGTYSLNSLTSGDSNVAVGYQSGLALTTGHNNVAIGNNALLNSQDIGFAVAIGNSVMASGTMTSAADGTVAIGQSTLTTLTSGIGNVAVGYEALKAEDDGDHNTAIGYQALVAQTGTSGTVANTAVGYKALDGILTGGYNVAVGANALGAADGAEGENVGIGYNAGINLNGGSNNIAIGSNTNFSTAAASNQVVIGKDATGVANNSVTLGNADTTAVYMAQDSGATVYAGVISGSELRSSGDVIAFYTSDERLKDNMSPLQGALDNVTKLNGYEFEWNSNQAIYKGHDIGVIAQDVEAVAPELVDTRADGYKAVKYEKLTALLIEAVTELTEQNQEMKAEIETLRSIISL